MLSKDMKFPAVFQVDGASPIGNTRIVITGYLAKGLFVGYTTASSNPLNVSEANQHPGIWNVTGDCKYTCVAEGPQYRRIKFGPKPDQVQYEKLTIDQRAILAALQKQPALAKNYLMESLKVDLNLANNINEYAFLKGYK